MVTEVVRRYDQHRLELSAGLCMETLHATVIREEQEQGVEDGPFGKEEEARFCTLQASIAYFSKSCASEKDREATLADSSKMMDVEAPPQGESQRAGRPSLRGRARRCRGARPASGAHGRSLILSTG